MKKLVSVLIIALITTSLFAGISFGAAVGYEQFNGKISSTDGDGEMIIAGRRNSPSVSLFAYYDVNEKMSAFEEIELLPKKSIMVKEDNAPEYKEVYDKAMGNMMAFKSRTGVDYLLSLDLPVDVYAGGSVVVGFTNFIGGSSNILLLNAGLGFNAKATYAINEKLTAFANANLDVAFYQMYKQDNPETPDDFRQSFDLSASYGIKAGLTYKF